MLRNGTRAIALGPKPMGLYVWWCPIDQRLSMWTTMVGPIAVVGSAIFIHPLALPLYGFWIALTRLVQTGVLAAARGHATWRYPFLLYFLQLWGSIVKIYMLFRMHRQSWTRQKTKAVRVMLEARARFLNLESASLHAASMLIFALAVLALSGPIKFG
jgi:glycosyltransferase Alg8